MFLDDLKIQYQKNKDKNPALVRNMLKEHIQHYLLHFVSQSQWADRFIFKGGTCLRFFFDLPRLSEDLDFDIINIETFDMDAFIKELKIHFVSKLQFDKIELKLANNKRTLYVKFPILRDIGITVPSRESDVLFVRIDVAQVIGTAYSTEISIKSVLGFSLLIKRYSVSDLMSGKIAAILTREVWEGAVKQERIKGRDYYDLIWFLEKNVVPNWKYFTEITKLTRQEALSKLVTNFQKASPSLISQDLMPFFQDSTFVKSFSQNLKELYKNYEGKLKND